MSLPPLPAAIATTIARRPVIVVELDGATFLDNAATFVRSIPAREVTAYATLDTEAGRCVIVLPDWLADDLDPARAEAANLGRAALVLAHEAEHCSGIADEAQAETAAGRIAPLVVRDLTRGHTTRRYARAAVSSAAAYNHDSPYLENPTP